MHTIVLEIVRNTHKRWQAYLFIYFSQVQWLCGTPLFKIKNKQDLKKCFKYKKNKVFFKHLLLWNWIFPACEDHCTERLEGLTIYRKGNRVLNNAFSWIFHFRWSVISIFIKLFQKVEVVVVNIGGATLLQKLNVYTLRHAHQKTATVTFFLVVDLSSIMQFYIVQKLVASFRKPC